MPIRQALPVLAELKIRAIEIEARGELSPKRISDTGIRHLRKLLSEHNMTLAALGYRTRHGYDVAENLEQRVEGTKAALRMAHDLGAPFVVNAIGNFPTDPADPRAAGMREALLELAAWGERVGATLACETGNETGEDIGRALAVLPEGTLAAAFNPGNLVRCGHSPLASLEALKGSIWYAYASDAIRGAPLDAGTDIALGQGSVDLQAMLGALETSGYRGTLTIDVFPGNNPLRRVNQAVSYLHNLY